MIRSYWVSTGNQENCELGLEVRFASRAEAEEALSIVRQSYTDDEWFLWGRQFEVIDSASRPNITIREWAAANEEQYGFWDIFRCGYAGGSLPDHMETIGRMSRSEAESYAESEYADQTRGAYVERSWQPDDAVEHHWHITDERLDAIEWGNEWPIIDADGWITGRTDLLGNNNDQYTTVDLDDHGGFTNIGSGCRAVISKHLVEDIHSRTVLLRKLERLSACPDGIAKVRSISNGSAKRILEANDYDSAYEAVHDAGLLKHFGWAWGRLFPTKWLAGADLQGVSLKWALFYNVDLSGVDFSRADLSMAHFVRVKLRGANFQGAILCNAILDGCDLTNANFTNANAIRTDFVRSTLDRTVFTNASLSGAIFSKGSTDDAIGLPTNSGKEESQQ